MEQLITEFYKLPISNDFLFKHVLLFKPICKHILEELFHTKIADITYLQTEETIDVYPDSHGIRLDVKIADANNTHYNLEMQVKNTKNLKTGKYLLPKRTRYYQAMLDVDMLQKGQDYDELAATYIIFFCLFDFFGANQRIYTFRKRCLENLDIELQDEATIIFLNTKGTNGKVSSDIQSLFDYINSNVITSDFTQEDADTIVNIKNDKKVRAAYMTYEMRMKDLRNEAFYEGEAVGIAKGEVKGKAEGKANEKFATVKRMLALGKTLQDIALCTDLPLAKVQELQAEM